MRARAASAAAAALLTFGLAACGSGKPKAGTGSTKTTAPLPGQGMPPITVGDTNTYPEQFVLGALYEKALQAKGYTVSLNRNIGPIEVRIKALESGSVDMYPEYINVWDTSIARYKRDFATARGAYQAGQRYALLHALKFLNPTPFSDTGAIGVTLSYAVDKGLNKIGDLRKIAGNLTIGGPAQFQSSSPGLTQVEGAYGFLPAAFKALPVGEQYKALDQNVVQAANVNTTDGQLDSGDYVLLTDTQHVFGWGNAVPVVSQKALEVEGPAFEQTVNAVSSLLTLRVIRQLNADVAVLNEDPAKVAEQFLEAHGMVPAGQSS